MERTATTISAPRRNPAWFRCERNEQMRSARNLKAEGRNVVYVRQAVEFARRLNRAAVLAKVQP